jgi:uncharacterized membrane protein
MDKKVFLNWTIMVLIVLELVLAASLSYKAAYNQNLCLFGEQIKCSDVQNSSYGSLFGIKVSYIALLGFVGLLALFLIDELFFFIATFIGALGAAYFITIQVFVLKQTCSTCLLLDSTMILILVLVITNHFIKKEKK